MVAQTQARNRVHAHLVVLVPGYIGDGCPPGHADSRWSRLPAPRPARGRRPTSLGPSSTRWSAWARRPLPRAAAPLARGDDPLLAIPGCGPLSAAVIRGEAGDVTRFRRPRRVRDVRGHRPGAGVLGEDQLASASTGAATAGSTGPSGRSRPGRRSSTPGLVPTSPASPRASAGRRPSGASSATSPGTSSRPSSRVTSSRGGI